MIDIKQLQYGWYFYPSGKPTPAVFEMVKLMQGRYLSWSCSQFFKKYENCWFAGDNNTGLIRFLKSKQNIYPLKLYMDNMTFSKEDMIYFHSGGEAREKDKDDFAEKLKDKLNSYDYLVDIDRKKIDSVTKEEIPDIPTALADFRKEKKEIYDYFKLPYHNKFSGTKGFNFGILSKWFPEYITPSERMGNNGIFYTISQRIANEMDFEHDMLVYLPTQVTKVPYSACNDNVVLPLTDTQIEYFNMGLVKIQNVQKTIMIKNRGLQERNHNLSDSQLKKNVEEFVDTYI